MKLNINIIIITLLVCCCSSAKIEAYNLLIMGDQGQYEVFKDNKFDKEETITLVNNGCKFYKKISEKDILDITLYDGNETLNEKNGLKNFSKIVSNNDFVTLLKNAHGIVFLGDVVYPESKDINIDKDTFEKWKKRLNCGWNVFIGTLKKMGIFTDGKLNSRVEILSGNHSYDVSVDEEYKILNKLISTRNPNFSKDNEKDIISTSTVLKVDKNSKDTSDKTTYKNNIQLITVNGNGFSVKIIDFNSSLVVCLGNVLEIIKKGKEDEYIPLKTDKDSFERCAFMKNFYQQELPTYEESIRYYKALKEAVNNTLTTDSNNWNVLRAHHPPVNFEDGDASFYFDKEIDGTNKSLFELFKEKNVNIFFGSHIHSQGVMLARFEGKVQKPNEIKLPKVKNSKGEEEYKIEYGCYIADGAEKQNKIISSDVKNATLKNCPQQLNLNFEINKDAMIVFITGNSGRKLDKISNGFKSKHGDVIWNRRVLSGTEESWGFSHATFSKDKVQVEFYELQGPKGDLTKVLTTTLGKTNKRRKYLKK